MNAAARRHFRYPFLLPYTPKSVSAHVGEYRRWIAWVLALVAAIEVSVLALRLAGVDARLWAGPFLVSIHSVYKPLWVALGAAAGLLMVAPDTRAWRTGALVGMFTAPMLALVVLARVSPSIVTKSDIAVTELYVQLAAKGHLLEGPYSRFGWHHPGPLYFWLQVPMYALGGHRGTALYAGALALNLTALGVLAWVLLRVDRGAFTITILAAWLLFAWRDRFTIASPWTGHIPVVPTVTFVILAAAVASRRRWMLPLLVFFGSLMTQSHVALVPLVAVLTGVAIVSLVATRRPDEPPLSPALHTSAWLLALLWVLPVAEQLSHDPGNLARLWDFFGGAGHAGKSFPVAFLAWSHALVGVLRPDLYTPYGGHFDLTHLGWGIPIALGQVAGLGVMGVRALRGGVRFVATLPLMALLASLVALWSITRIQGDIVDHEIFWITPLGAMNLGILAAPVVRRVAAMLRLPSRPQVATIVVAPLLLACIYTGFRDFERLVDFETNRPKDAVIAATYESVRNYLSSNDVRKPLFRIVGVWDVAAAVLLRLHASRIPFAVEDSALLMFTEAFSAHGDEDAIITIAERRLEPPAGTAKPVTVLQGEPVYVEAFRVER
jgi:hypothetical protein